MQEIDRLTDYLDFAFYRNINTIDLSIYRKPTHADITIQSSSNRPLDHKLAAFSYYINRMITFFFFFIRRLTSSFESFGPLNDIFPCCSILYTGCPIFNFHLSDILYDVIFPSLFWSSFGSCR